MKVTPIFIPRGCEFVRKRLFASVVLTFNEEPAEVADKAVLEQGLDALQNLLAGPESSGRLVFTVEIASSVDTSTTHTAYFRRVRGPYPLDKAIKSWRVILDGISSTQATAGGLNRSQSPLARRYLEHAAGNGTSAPVEPATANPAAASEFSPGWRVESPESHGMLKTAELHYKRGAGLEALPKSRRQLLEVVCGKLFPQLGDTLLKRIHELKLRAPAESDTWMRERDAGDEAYLRLQEAIRQGALTARGLAHVMAPLVEREAGKLLSSPDLGGLETKLLAEWRAFEGEKNSPARALAIQSLGARILAKGAGVELDRSKRSLEANQNRPVRKMTREEVENVSFGETVARFTQHPGLMRGLWLTHDLELDLSQGELPPWVPANSSADLAMTVTGLAIITSSGAVQPVVLPLPWDKMITMVELSSVEHGDYFRAKPAHPGARYYRGLPTVTGGPGLAEDAWRRWQLVSGTRLAVDQADGMSLAATGETSAAASARGESAPRLRSEGFAFRWKESGNESMAAAAHDRLRNAAKGTSRNTGVALSGELRNVLARDAKLKAAAQAYFDARAASVHAFIQSEAEKSRRGEPPGELTLAALGSFVSGHTTDAGIKAAAAQTKAAGELLAEIEEEARAKAFYAEDLARGLAFEGRYLIPGTAERAASSGGPHTTDFTALEQTDVDQTESGRLSGTSAFHKWHRLCLRKVELFPPGQNSLPLLSFEEESFLASSVTQAAPPIVGILAANVSQAVEDRGWMDRHLKVRLLVSDPQGASVEPGPEHLFWCVDPSNLDEKIPKPATSRNPFQGETKDPTSVRCLIRARATAADLRFATWPEAMNQDAGDRIRLHITEEVFDKEDTPKAGVGWVACQIIASPVFEIGSPFEMPANPGDLGLVLATNYVRGEVYSFLFSQEATGFVDSIGAGYLWTVEEPKLPDEFNRFLAEGDRRYYALDSLDLVPDGNPRVMDDSERITSKDFLLNSSEWPDFFLAVGIQDLPGDRVRARNLPFAPAVSWAQERNWLELVDGADLEGVRGPVSALALEAAGEATLKPNGWIIAGTPEILIPTTCFPGITTSNEVVRVRGSYLWQNSRLEFQSDASAVVIPEKTQQEEYTYLRTKRAVAIVATIAVETSRKVEFDVDFIAAVPVASDFIKTQELQSGTWIEAIGGRREDRIIARGYPRYPVATVIDQTSGSPIKRVVVFADGTRRESECSAANVQIKRTGRLNYTEVVKVPASPAPRVIESTVAFVANNFEPFRLIGEIAPFQESSTPPAAPGRELLVFELVGTGKSKRAPRVRVPMSGRFHEADNRLADRHANALEPGDYVIVRAEAAMEGGFAPVEDGGFQQIAAGIRGKLTRQRASAAAVIAQAGADYEPAGATTGQDLSRVIWVKSEALTAVDGKMFTGAVAPLVLLRRAIVAPLAGVAASGLLQSIKLGSPTLLESRARHGLKTGMRVRLSGIAGGTPDINRAWLVTTAKDDLDRFSIPVETTVAGNGGTWTRVLSAPLAGAILKVETGTPATTSLVITDQPHRLSTGDWIRVLKSSHAAENGEWVVAVVSGTTFSVDAVWTPTATSAAKWVAMFRQTLAGKIAKVEKGAAEGTSLVTTDQPHDLTSGDRIRISKSATAAENQAWAISVESAGTFTVAALWTETATSQAEWEAVLPEPVQAGISDLIARWSGWSMGCALPGQADEKAEPEKTDRWRIKVSVPSRTTPPPYREYSSYQLPLRHSRSYQFRCWQVDLAGNNGMDPQVFNYRRPGPHVGAFGSPEYQRVTEVQLPLLAFPPVEDRGVNPVAAKVPDTPYFLTGDFRSVSGAIRALLAKPGLCQYFPPGAWEIAQKTALPDTERRLFLAYILNECLRDENLPDVLTTQAERKASDPTLLEAGDQTLLKAWEERRAAGNPSGDGTPAILLLNRRLLERILSGTVKKAPEGITRQWRLVLLTDPGGPDGEIGPFHKDHELWARETRCFLLPPSASEETVMATGILDSRTPAFLRELFSLRRLHAVRGMLNERSSLGPRKLNYLPDPDASGRAEEVPPWTLFVWDGVQYLRAPLNFGPAPDFDKWSSLTLEAMDAGTHPLELRGFGIAIPRGRHSFACLDHSQESRDGSLKKKDLEERNVPDLMAVARIELIHAVTQPLVPPDLARWQMQNRRLPGDTAQQVGGLVNVDRPSTGALTVVAHWDDYWDESVTVIRQPAVARATIKNGKVHSVDLVKGPDGKVAAGSGFGSEAIVHLVEPGQQPVLTLQGGRFLMAPKPVLTRETIACKKDGNHTHHPVLAKFKVHLVENRVDRVDVLEGGKGYGSYVPPDNPGPGKEVDTIEVLAALILQRPPLVETAKARCNVVKGRITGCTFDTNDAGEKCRGGYYIEPPDVWLDDPEGTGQGGELIAILDGYGEIAQLHVLKGGTNYSEFTRVRINTHRQSFPEIPVEAADRGVAARPEIIPSPVPLSLLHSFTDPFHHSVEYAVLASSAYRDIFKSEKGAPGDAKWRTLQSSIVKLQIPSSVIPVSPEPSSLWLAFRMRQPQPPLQGMWCASFETAIRVYLQRPWRAEDQLAVVTGQAEINAVSGDNTNWLRLTPKQREYTSEWAFDPAWRELELPTLHRDRFGGRVLPSQPYAHPVMDPAPAAGGQATVETDPPPPVNLALYEVEWDAQRQEWYADVHLKGPIGGPTFVKLAIGRFQSYSLPGLELSPIVSLDMIAFPGHRGLEITSPESGKLRFEISGDMGGEIGKDANGIALRMITVELRRRPLVTPGTPPSSALLVPAKSPPDGKGESGKPGTVEVATVETEALGSPSNSSEIHFEGNFYHGDPEIDTLLLVEKDGKFSAVTGKAWEQAILMNEKSSPGAGKDEVYFMVREGILRESIAPQDEQIIPRPEIMRGGQVINVARQRMWHHAISLAEIIRYVRS
ncbi:MAG: hypothetical protein V4819_21030 [Verrucomicrobiota bacterium]